MNLRYAWLILPLLLAGCGQPTATPQYAANFDKLKPGMPRLKVQELLGEPNRADYNKNTPKPIVYAPGGSPSEREELARSLGGPAEPPWAERWQYGRFTLRDLSNLLYGADQAFIVYFDRDAAVIAFRRPLTGPFAPSTQPAHQPL